MSASRTATPTLYFGYGSNLWLHQMAARCPKATYQGIAKLKNWRWIINERGYANIVPSDQGSNPPDGVQKDGENSRVRGEHDCSEEVWGMVYALTDSDEVALDVNEGVPHVYGKEHLEVELWPAIAGDQPAVATTLPGRRVTVLTYVDRLRVKPSAPKAEYVYRMNMGIKDAVVVGVPRRWIEKVVRVFIPECRTVLEDDVVREVAERQARYFVDE